VAIYDDAARPDAAVVGADDAAGANAEVNESKRDEVASSGAAAQLDVDGVDAAAANARVECVLWRELGRPDGHELFEKFVQWPRVWVATPRGD